MNDFSIIIPTLNEAENVFPLLQRLSGVARDSNLRFEVIFVDDGSTDGTCKIIGEYNGTLDIRLIQRQDVRGLAGAVVHGARQARYDHVLVMDADLSHQPESIANIIRPLLLGQSDLVIGSRYTDGGTIIGWPARRRILSKAATLPAHWLTGVEDPLSGFFAVRKELITTIDEDSKGFKILFQLLQLHGRSIRVLEMPISFSDRNHGASKLSTGVGLAYLAQLLHSFALYPSISGSAAHPLWAIIIALLDATLFYCLAPTGLGSSAAHMIGFTVTVPLFLFLGLRLPAGTGREESSSRPFRPVFSRLLLLFPAALFIRGGLVALSENSHLGLLPEALILGVFSAAVWYGFAASLRKPAASLSPGAAIILIIVYSLLLRLLYLGNTELIQEEAYYWNYAQHMAPGYLDHPPMVAVLIWLGTALLGDTEFGVRIGAYLCWFVSAFYGYSLTKRMIGAATARYAVLLIAVLPVFFGVALVMTPDAPLMACWSASLYYLYRALVEEEKISWIWAGAAVGFGLLSKYTIALLGFPAVTFLLLDRRARKWLTSPMPYLSVLTAIIIFLPVIFWNMENGWASFLFQSKDRITEAAMFSTDRLILFILLLLTPTGGLAVLLTLLPGSLRYQKNTGAGSPSRSYLFTMLMVLLPLLVFFLASIFREVKLNWTGPIWLAAVPFMSLTLAAAFEERHGNGKGHRLLAGCWPKTIFSLVFLYGVCLHYLSIGLPGVPYVKNTILLGWDSLAVRVEEKVKEVEKDRGSRPVVVGMDRYRIASGMAFYRQKTGGVDDTANNFRPQTTGRHLFGFTSLMFQYWHPKPLFSSRDVLAVSHSRAMLQPGYFRNLAREIGPIRPLTVEKQGKIVATYFCRLLKNYLPVVQPGIAVNETRSYPN